MMKYQPILALCFQYIIHRATIFNEFNIDGNENNWTHTKSGRMSNWNVSHVKTLLTFQLKITSTTNQNSYFNHPTG